MIHHRPSVDRPDDSCDAPSIGTLLKSLTGDTRNLLRQEIELAKAEITQKAQIVGRNALVLAIGALIAHAAVLALIGALCFGIADLINEGSRTRGTTAIWLGMLIVGMIAGLTGYLLIQKALATMKRESVPRDTINTLRENTEWLKDHMKTSESRVSHAEHTIR